GRAQSLYCAASGRSLANGPICRKPPQMALRPWGGVLVDWKTFLASMTSALAWPLVAAILLFLLREQLPALMKRIKAASVGGAKFEFDKALDDAKDSAEALKTSETAQAMRAEPNEKYLKL